MSEGKSINRLNGLQQSKFLKWFEDQTFEYGVTDQQIAVKATTDLGFNITVGNVYGAWDVTEKKRPVAPKTENQKLGIIKRAVESLYREMGCQLPPEWTDL